MKVLIVDDEPKAIDLIQGYLQHFKSLKLVGTFRNGLKAFEFINSQEVDLVFMDINMPDLSGISLSKMLNSNIKIIFTTAYEKYAVESYEVEAIDYLLKPISFERFTKAISRVLTYTNFPEQSTKSLIIKSGTKLFQVDPTEILYLKKDGNYVTYHLQGKKILARESVSESLAQLPKYFVQVHKSFIININKINFLERDEIDIQGARIPIGMSFKDNLTSAIKKT